MPATETTSAGTLPDGPSSRLAVIKERAVIQLRRGAGPDLAGELEELVGAHPLDESLMILLMRALVAAGRVPEALDRYERLRSLLADQLGTDPGRELQELHLQLLRGEGIPASPTPAIARTPSNLRAWLTSFVGRDDDVARVLDSVRANRLTTIVGPGGAGKTRLATETAAHWLDDYTTEAAWLVELAPVTEPANIPTAILGARSPDRWVRAALLATAAFSAENDSDVAGRRRRPRRPDGGHADPPATGRLRDVRDRVHPGPGAGPGGGDR